MRKGLAKILMMVVAGMMALVTAVHGPASVLSVVVAAERGDYQYLESIVPSAQMTTYYISEVKVGTYESLKAEGYMVDEESATNRYYDEDGNLCYQGDTSNVNGSGYCIGYKLTTDPDDAIYDLSVMDMYGEYTELSYREVLAEQQKNMTAMANRIMDAAEKLGDLYSEGSTYAKLAVETLNNMTITVERAVGDESKTFEYPLGDYFVGNVDEDLELQDFLDLVFLCSTSTTGFIYNQLSMGIFDDLSQKGATSWLTRLGEVGPLVIHLCRELLLT